ncbi:hypothetical protein LNAOJCKE_0433 [Methylorubrum aminovorans]|uniref:Uncharacterized protein n=1 Tax=Methylorubrum aminovorans TaxID=269069 RepID=A0ABQ4U714_9HYPH|nr:hypothetical protein [Methylorubrum aminovorans]GJE63239.1 hypothetical protein LNAOJCKE_0433 [Methylorubrum aminovorans]GMA79286.1 hypothetical protein GCM10025880_57030 [Methylorubrum aminovorans]
MSRGIVHIREQLFGSDYTQVFRFDETSILKRLGAKAAKNYSKKASEMGGAIIAYPNRVHINIGKFYISDPTNRFVESYIIGGAADDEGHFTQAFNEAGDFKVYLELDPRVARQRTDNEQRAEAARLLRQNYASARNTAWLHAMYRLGHALDRNNPYGHLPEPAPRDHQVTITTWSDEGPARDEWAAEWDAWAEEHLRGGWHFDVGVNRTSFVSQSLSEATAVKLRWG